MQIQKFNDALHTMYPSTSNVFKVKSDTWLDIPIGSSVYFYVIKGYAKIYNGDELILVIGSNCVVAAAYDQQVFLTAGTKVWIVTRYGFKVPLTITKPENKGRLPYIDGCSDSLLVFPPRKGDGSLSLLYFPQNILQSWHSHPSIRLGYIVSGMGIAEWVDSDGNEQSKMLQAGKSFMLDEQISHRFCTENSELRILAYHPDGDWGPEDRNHTMLNRTYLSNK